jgi:hypothetical protein
MMPTDHRVMAIPDYHIHQQARAYIEAHGENAAVKARERTADLEARGDRIGADMWTRVVAAIEEMQGAT